MIQRLGNVLLRYGEVRCHLLTKLLLKIYWEMVQHYFSEAKWNCFPLTQHGSCPIVTAQ